jgi:dephospho-CoA kinase
MIIGLTGPKLAGKGTAADFLVKEHGATTYSMSGILTELVERLYLDNSRQNLIQLATGLRQSFGEDLLARVLKEDIAQAKPELAVIDGIRLASEVEQFSQLDDFRLVYIDAPVRVRYERALQRGEKVGETEMTFKQFEEEETAVTERQIETLRNWSKAIVINETDVAAMNEKLTVMVRS